MHERYIFFQLINSISIIRRHKGLGHIKVIFVSLKYSVVVFWDWDDPIGTNIQHLSYLL